MSAHTNHNLYALDLQTGQFRWKYATGGRLGFIALRLAGPASLSARKIICSTASTHRPDGLCGRVPLKGACGSSAPCGI